MNKPLRAFARSLLSPASRFRSLEERIGIIGFAAALLFSIFHSFWVPDGGGEQHRFGATSDEATITLGNKSSAATPLQTRQQQPKPEYVQAFVGPRSDKAAQRED